MMRISPVRGALALATLAAGLGGALAPAAPGVALTASPRVAASVPHTNLTFDVDGCKKCEVQVTQARRRHVWQSPEKTVQDGQVSFRFRTTHSHGLSATVRAPWEGTTGYVTLVVFRYAKEDAGSKVSLREALTKRRASACWAGTEESTVTLPLKVRKVRVHGTTGPTDGSIAWTGTTQHWWRPMEPTLHGLHGQRGVLGTQDVHPCTKG